MSDAPNKSRDKVVTFQVWLPNEAYQALKKLQELCGHATIEETLEKALRLYMAAKELGLYQVVGIISMAPARHFIARQGGGNWSPPFFLHKIYKF